MLDLCETIQQNILISSLSYSGQLEEAENWVVSVENWVCV